MLYLYFENEILFLPLRVSLFTMTHCIPSPPSGFSLLWMKLFIFPSLSCLCSDGSVAFSLLLSLALARGSPVFCLDIMDLVLSGRSPSSLMDDRDTYLRFISLSKVCRRYLSKVSGFFLLPLFLLLYDLLSLSCTDRVYIFRI